MRTIKDKNGKEIKVGDILNHDWSDDWVVKIENGNFIAEEDIGDGDRIYIILSDWSKNKDEQGLEVIGNIYENPELLE